MVNDPDESRLDEVLRQLEEAPEAVSKAFGAPKGTPTPREQISSPYDLTRRSERRVYGPKVEPSRIRPYPNVYLVKEGEPVEWVGFFHSEEAATKWIEERKETFIVEFGPKRDLPMWGREERKRLLGGDGVDERKRKHGKA